VEEAQETLKHVQKIGVTVLASKWITSNTRPEVIPYEEHTTTKTSSSITENLFSLIKSSDAQTVPPKQINPTINKKPQELPSILKKRSPEESPVISGSGKLQCIKVGEINSNISFIHLNFLYHFCIIHKTVCIICLLSSFLIIFFLRVIL